MRKLGEILKATPKNTGVAGKAGPGRGKPGAKKEPGLNEAPTLDELGLTKKESAIAQKLAGLSDQAEVLQLEIVKQRANPSVVTERSQRDADKLVKDEPELAKLVWGANLKKPAIAESPQLWGDIPHWERRPGLASSGSTQMAPPESSAPTLEGIRPHRNKVLSGQFSASCFSSLSRALTV
jgi:hypothetical protein